MMLPNTRRSKYNVKWVFSIVEEKESGYFLNYIHKIRIRKERQPRCGKPNEITEISWQGKIL